MKEIYFKLLEKNKNISRKTKDIIITYLTNEKNISFPEDLINLIVVFKNIRKEVFCKITKYTLEETDFFSYEETDNFKFYKGLIDNQIITIDLGYKESEYIKKIEKSMNILYKKIKTFDIKYNDIITFFESEKNKNIFKQKLSYLNFLDEIKTEKNMANLECKVKEVKKKINDFELILGDFEDFFNQKHKKDIAKIKKINEEIKSSNLNCFQKKYVGEYEKYSKYLDEAKRRKKLKESIFFNEILKYNQKNNFKKDEEIFLKDTESAFEKIQIILAHNGVLKIDEKFLELCLKPFKENNQKIKNELKILAEIFKVDAYIDNIYEEILLFLNRKFILDVAFSIFYFNKTIEPIKTNFIKTIENIMINIKKVNDIQSIKFSKEKMIELEIFNKDENEKEGENELINILLKFREQSDSILFLLKISFQDLTYLKEITSSKDNKYNVSILDIENMEKCVEFFKDIGTLDEMQKMKDSDIIKKIKQKAKGKNDISIYCEKYVNNYGKIRLLMNDNKIFQMNQNLIQNNKTIYKDDEYQKLIIQLKYYKEEIDKLKKMINKLRTDNNRLCTELINAQKIISSYKDIHQQSNKENITNFNNLINEKDTEIDDIEITNKKNIDYNKIMVVNFISSDYNINCGISCFETETFAEIEEKLYQQNEKCRETNNNFIFNGNEILRFKKISENKIKNGDKILLLKPQ